MAQNKLRVFITGRLFQASLIFPSKAGAFQSVAPYNVYL